MPSLPDIQRNFLAAIFNDAPSPTRFPADLPLSPMLAQAGVDIYQRSIIGNLSGALENCYPVVAEVVGDAFFREAARQYIITTPSHSGDLNEFGNTFADFLAIYPYAGTLPYLSDLARLEWLVQSVYYAPDTPCSKHQDLANISPEDYASLHFVVAPDHARMDSPWPVASIWQSHQPDGEAITTINLAATSRALILRNAGQVQVKSLTTGEASLFDALASGEPLGQAARQALATDAELDLAMSLENFVAARLFTGILCPEGTAG